MWRRYRASKMIGLLKWYFDCFFGRFQLPSSYPIRGQAWCCICFLLVFLFFFLSNYDRTLPRLTLNICNPKPFPCKSRNLSLRQHTIFLRLSSVFKLMAFFGTYTLVCQSKYGHIRRHWATLFGSQIVSVIKFVTWCGLPRILQK